ncbi:hypothetical protein SAMN04487859_10565 [Roseovarius lutimaris]|jgi:hypothetical protein|uniref:Osmotically inducible lipoprotein OsmB n=1 Tax=Roseovarius lutimaris TaxID=1005928 RepID=A0A1I5A4Z3_9RHOB|nr:hypothetical protein [Roseovarius lutimaris]MDA3857246.1 hypothetical protein [Roseovarius sp.]SFN57523.1 hypothetical protein SAMN04487859_10565 [Roseovarius lutimaris]
MHTIQRKVIPMLSALALMGLAACGDTVPEQALLGGGAGAVTGAVVGGSVITGAAVGAAGNVVYCQAYPSRCN